MQTKDEERAIVLNIVKQLNKADEDGWVASAFEGCVGLAYKNIDEDAVNSPYDWKCERDNLKEELEKVNKNYVEYIEATDERINFLRTSVQTLQNERNELEELNVNYQKQLEENDNVIQGLENEIIRLKAKLYDMMERI